MTERIVVAGDVHLGAANADAAAFDAFLDDLLDGIIRADRLVLLGDVWDLVRRDPFGCAWETAETVARLKRLLAEMPVAFLLGNHDTYLRNLDSALYDASFHTELVLESGDTRIRFTHGNEFDRLQSDRLSAILSGPGDRGDVDPTRGRKDPVVAAGRELLQAGKRRLRNASAAAKTAAGTLGGERFETDGGIESGSDPTSDGHEPHPRRERRAHAHLESIPEEKLVFGHTHRPYVRADNAVANPGSWKTTHPVHATYLVVDDGEFSLYRYADSGADELLAPSDGRDD